MKRLRILIGTFVSVGLAVVLVVSPASAQPAFDPPGLDRAIASQERHTDSLLANPDVVGTAVGHGAQGRAVIFVFTVEPGVVGIPTELDGVPVVAHVTGEIFAFPKPDKTGKPPKDNGGEVDPKSRFDRPVPIGVSSGNVKHFFSDGVEYCSVGTLGARVTDGTAVYALSNNHVYAHTNTASIGDAIVQPGTVDIDPVCSDNSATDSIGTLHDYEPLKFDPSACDASQGSLDPDCNIIDAAIALSSTANLGNSTPSDGYGTPRSTTVAAVINAKLEKYGRTTGPTKALVWAINSTVDVNYGPDADGDPQIARFVGQIVAKGSGFSRGGDSGSLVVQVMGKGKNKSYYPVGLLFAGSSFFELTWLNPIDLVLTVLRVTIDGEP